MNSIYVDETWIECAISPKRIYDRPIPHANPDTEPVGIIAPLQMNPGSLNWYDVLRMYVHMYPSAGKKI